MSTYEEFMIILNVGLLIVAILNLKNKKEHPRSGKVGCYFFSLIAPETDRFQLSFQLSC